MENNVELFFFGQKKVRIVEQDGKFWFFACDVGHILGLRNVRDSINKVLEKKDWSYYSLDMRSVEFGIYKIYSTDKNHSKRLVITEAGLYRLTMRSNMTEARRFQQWIAECVLPSIRETGSYSMHQENQTALPSVLPQNKESEQAIEIHRGKSKKFISLTTPKMTLEVPANAEGYDFIHEILRDYL